MIKKILLFFLFIAMSSITYSQKKPKIIIGKITDSLGIVKNANIINLKTNQGTFSSDQGLYRIFVSEGDILSFSSVQHQTKKIVITEDIIDQKELNIYLKGAIYNLDEFDLKRHNLMGRLDADLKDVPNNKKDELLRSALDFSNIDFSEVDPRIDANIKAKPPENNVDPTQKFAGAGAAAVMPFKYSERLWALRKELARKKAFPYKVLSELGEQFFFDELKIPIENYFHFLEYCNPLGIEDLHKDGKILELIKILRSESISYLKINKKE